ncbi:MAG TPA: hypothetical protein VI365_26350 [Trebonia sp.]
MAFEGMDVDRVQELAQQVDHYALSLSQVTAAAASLAEDLTGHWRGLAAAAFQQDWEYRHRPALMAAAAALAQTHTRLVANISQQQQASAAAGGDGPMAGGAVLDIASAGRKLDSVIGVAGPILGAAKWLSDNKSVTGRYTKSWDQVRDDWRSLKETLHLPVDPDNEFLKYKSWPVIQDAHDIIEATHAGPVIDAANKLLDPLTIPLTMVNGAQALNDLSQHHYNAAVDQTAEALKDSKDGYLFGVALESVHVAYEEGAKIDWTEKMPSLTEENLRTIYLPSAGEGLSTFPEDLKEIFF